MHPDKHVPEKILPVTRILFGCKSIKTKDFFSEALEMFSAK